MIVPIEAEPDDLAATVASIRAQTVPVRLVAVSIRERRVVQAMATHADELIDLPRSRWTSGRALNLAASMADTPLLATVRAGLVLPRPDWVERVVAHLERPGVAGVAGAALDALGNPLLDPRTLRAEDWSPDCGFSTNAAAWRADVWSRHPFPENVPAAEGPIWARGVLQANGVLVLDPFLAAGHAPGWRPSARAILRQAADERASLVAAGAPVDAPSLPGALRLWWRRVDPDSGVPPILQRLNYYTLARELGHWAGGRRARRDRRA
jgi:Glycosyl transferase family 2